MYNLLKEGLFLFTPAIYIQCRGTSETKTIQTGEEFSYTYPYGEGELKLTSSEYLHEVSFKRWFLPKQVRYTYLIQVNKIVDGEKELLEVLPMPMLCSKRFAGTSLPHRLAVSECLQKFYPN